MVFKKVGSKVDPNIEAGAAAATAGDIDCRLGVYPATGNWLSSDKKSVMTHVQLNGMPNNTDGNNTKPNTDLIITALKTGVATAQMANSWGASAAKFSEAALAAPVAATCAYKTAADCKASADCKTGALSTVVAVGASIAALAMAF